MATPMVNLETATHVAGPSVELKNRTIQRCLVCGEKLGDSADPELKKFWSEGEIIKAERGFLRSYSVELLSVKRLPDDFCIALVER